MDSLPSEPPEKLISFKKVFFKKGSQGYADLKMFGIKLLKKIGNEPRQGCQTISKVQNRGVLDIGKARQKNQDSERSGGITDTKLGSSRETKTSGLEFIARGREGTRERGGRRGRKEPSKPCYKDGPLNVMSLLIDKEGRIAK